MNKLKELKLERDKLREEIKDKSISIWKFWEGKKDRELLGKSRRICDINNILEGAELQMEFSKGDN